MTPRALQPRAWAGLLALALLLGGALAALDANLLGGAATPTAAAAQPTPTYVSELGPATMIPPRHSAVLPIAGGGADARPSLPWPKLAGLGLAVLGSVLVYTALTLRPERSG